MKNYQLRDIIKKVSESNLEGKVRKEMNYIGFEYYILIIVIVILYYLLPRPKRWVALLIGSGYFYCKISGELRQILIFLSSVIISFSGACLLDKLKNRRVRIVLLWVTIIFSSGMLIVFKFEDLFMGKLVDEEIRRVIEPIGLSFYTLQIISYVTDVYYHKTHPQKNLLKYALFISFFPQVIQGPIPRYGHLGKQLLEGNKFYFENLVRGAQLIGWGFFLKLMIADKAGIVVNEIFNHYRMYAGTYIIIAGILYSIQLYTDFLACTVIARGGQNYLGLI